ncbi:MAG: acyl-CoA dehydrogenase family protein [Actinomycetota bacterium]
MEAELTHEQERFRSELRAWLKENVPRDPEPAEPHAAFQRRRSWHRRLASAGYVGVDWPVEYGARSLGPVERVLLDDELGRAGAPTIAGLIGVYDIAPAIIAFGTSEQRSRFVAPIRAGEEIWCQGMSEPGAGSDLAALGTRAFRNGDHFVVDGHKIWCSNADEADWCQLFVRTSSDGPKHAGITCILVNMRTPGIEVRPIKVITGSADFCEVFLDGVRVPGANVLGEVGGGWSVAIHTLMNERLGALTLQTGIRRMLEEAIDLARTNGRSFDPVLRQALGDAYASATVLQALGLRVLRGLSGGSPGPEGSVLKVFGADLTQRIAELGLDIAETGPRPVEHAAVRWQHRFLESRAITIAGGTSEVLRNVIGERILGLPKG